MISQGVKNIYIPLVLLFFVACAITNPYIVFASTSIEFTSTVPGLSYSFTDFAAQVQSKSDLNGPFLADGFALANITGYPNSAATIGSFPHFEVGIATGAGCTNMEYFQEGSEASENGSFPMIIPNPVLHFGFGILGGLDVIGKIFMFDSRMYELTFENDLATPEEYRFLSLGGRVRYNIVPRFTIVPILFSFGGITIAAGADGMIGKIKVHGEYETYFENVPVSGGGLPADYTIERVDFTGSYNAKINWKVISGTVNALAYLEFFTIFTFYAGFGITLGTGFFSIHFEGTGNCTTTDAIYQAIAGTNDVGTLTFISNNKYQSHPFIPTFIVGTEIGIFFINAHAETMVNLYNGKDVTALLGIRFQI
ncbi:MAG: hypothetical protein N2316_01520 [Spirochaetes bacterium]|nr:hypothetical protein [Spirochaetota bacterium]